MFMSFKLLKLHWNIFFWTLTGKIKKLQSRLNIHPKQATPEKILIVFPIDEPSFRVALYSFRDLGHNTMDVNYTFLVNSQFQSLFHIQKGRVEYIDASLHDEILNRENSLVRSLKPVNFDMIIDLNPEFHIGISKVISNLKADLKVGFSSRFSDKFYNIQLDVSKSGIMEKGFQQINLMLAE